MDLGFDCTACGACCVGPDDATHYISVYDGDLARLEQAEVGRLADQELQPTKFKTKRDSLGRRVCAALDGVAGKSCRCSVYERRPEVCEMFEPETPECLLARNDLGFDSYPTG